MDDMNYVFYFLSNATMIVEVINELVGTFMVLTSMTNVLVSLSADPSN